MYKSNNNYNIPTVWAKVFNKKIHRRFPNGGFDTLIYFNLLYIS